jgi:hypothetical protein
VSSYNAPFDLLPVAEGPAVARRVLRLLTRLWCTPVSRSDAELVITELVCNAIDHADVTTGLSWWPRHLEPDSVETLTNQLCQMATATTDSDHTAANTHHPGPPGRSVRRVMVDRSTETSRAESGQWSVSIGLVGKL